MMLQHDTSDQTAATPTHYIAESNSVEEDNSTDIDAIEPCRTCGVYYMKHSNFLRHIFATDKKTNAIMLDIRMEFSTWNLGIIENDGLPQYICTGCIHEFQRGINFRQDCVKMQTELRYFNELRMQNNKIIKTEWIDPDEEAKKYCGFIYVDELSDNECDYNKTPFDIPHIPIKMEHFEEAKVPVDTELVSTMATGSNEMDKINERDTNVQQTTATMTIINVNNVNDIVQNSIVPFTDNANDISLKPTIHCQLCANVSNDPESHSQHMDRIHRIKDLECHICGRKFKNATARRLKFHLKWHRLSKHLKCAQCGFYCSTRDILLEHKRAVHTKIKCHICEKHITAQRFKSHLREHAITTPPKPMRPIVEEICTIKCSQCEKIFNDSNTLNLHINEMHNINAVKENVPIDLSTSEEVDTSIDSTFKLELSELNLQPKSDTITDDSDNTDYVGTDSDEEGDNGNSRAFRCAKCPSSFETVELLLEHHMKHEGEQEILKCQMCGKEFNLKFSLNRHLRKHTNATF